MHPADVRFAAGVVTGIGFGDRRLAWADLVHDAYFQRVQLWAAGFYRTEGLHWDSARMQGEPFKYFAYGAAASEVEVDGFTGAYRVLRADIVHDVGDSLSPLIDLGQIEGGFVQGVGWLTLEELRWDETDGPHRAGWPPRPPAPTRSPASPSCRNSSTCTCSSGPPSPAWSTDRRRWGSRR